MASLNMPVTGDNTTAPAPTTLDPDAEYPYCNAVPGIGPHDYQPFLDFMQGKSIGLCSQCGETFEIGDLDINLYMPILANLGLPVPGSPAGSQPGTGPLSGLLPRAWTP